jgi:hypothetical protein
MWIEGKNEELSLLGYNWCSPLKSIEISKNMSIPSSGLKNGPSKKAGRKQLVT